MKTLGDALHYCNASTPIAESELIIAAAIERSKGTIINRLELYSDVNQRLDLSTIDIIKRFTKLRSQGLTLQYLTGKQRFLDHDYRVGKGVLVPRPETEQLVQAASEMIKNENLKSGIEIGIGSGAVSIELLFQFSELTMTATEISDQAIVYAYKNAFSILKNLNRLQIAKISKPDDVVDTLSHKGSELVDFIISNPPYMAMDDEIGVDVIQNEPHTALFSIQSPNYFYEQIARKGGVLLKPDGRILVEIPEMRSAAIRQLFSDQGWESEVRQDLNGRDRVLIAKQRTAH
jgi:release factor glutamine methyltransferase